MSISVRRRHCSTIGRGPVGNEFSVNETLSEISFMRSVAPLSCLVVGLSSSTTSIYGFNGSAMKSEVFVPRGDRRGELNNDPLNGWGDRLGGCVSSSDAGRPR